MLTDNPCCGYHLSCSVKIFFKEALACKHGFCYSIARRLEFRNSAFKIASVQWCQKNKLHSLTLTMCFVTLELTAIVDLLYGGYLCSLCFEYHPMLLNHGMHTFGSKIC